MTIFAYKWRLIREEGQIRKQQTIEQDIWEENWEHPKDTSKFKEKILKLPLAYIHLII